MRELNVTEVREVSGANLHAIFSGLVAVTTFLSTNDSLHKFGTGLGIGLYDGLHKN